MIPQTNFRTTQGAVFEKGKAYDVTQKLNGGQVLALIHPITLETADFARRELRRAR